MHATRRDFLQSAAASAAGAILLGSTLLPAMKASALQAKPAAKKRILILGGTGFIGPAIIEAALAKGHSVTIFNRGVTEKRKGIAVDGVEKLVGDRDPKVGDGLKSLEGKKWDAVIDNCGYVPRIVQASAELLAPNVGQYIYISSISAFKETSIPDQDESAPVGTMADPTVESMGASYENYGPLKALCEAAAEKAMPGRVANVRPGYIVGPGDSTDRFTYWPVRVKRGGEVLAPGTPNDPIQVIDVRDLAAWLMVLIDNNTTGLFSATGPATTLTMGTILDTCKSVTGSDATFTWVDAEFLQANSKEPGGLPIWAPATGETAGFHRANVSRAIKAGLVFRPIKDTIKDTLEWIPKELERRATATKRLIDEAIAAGKPAPKVGDPSVLRAGLSPEAEKELLEAWHKNPTATSPVK